MHRKDLVLSMSSLSMFILYFFSNTAHNGIMYDLTIDLDHAIPLIPMFIVPYFSYFVFIPTTIYVTMQKSLKYLRFFLFTILGMMLFSHACFWFFPTHLTIRPEITSNDFFSQLTKLLYSFDNPYAACPSVHVNMSTLCALIWRKIKHPLATPMIFWAIIVIFSTVLLKQHFVLDVVAGIASAFIFYFGVSALVARWPELVEGGTSCPSSRNI